MYNYSYVAHSRVNNNVAAPAPTVFNDDVLITSITPSEVTISVQGYGIPVTATFTGSFTYVDVPTTGVALVNGTLSATLFSKSVYVNGALSFEETWVDGTDWLLGDTDFAYELSKLSGNDYFEGSRTAAIGDTVQGLAGNDRFKGFGDNVDVDGRGDRFYGGDGLDTSVYLGKISEYQINSSKGTEQSPHIWDARFNDANTTVADAVRTPGFYVRDRVVSRDGLDALAEVERLEFEVAEANGANRVALDLDGNGGSAAKILGALWGKESVENPTFVGIALYYLDSGVSYEALLDLALGAILGANKTNEAIVELVYTNLVGVAPTDSETKELASYMDSGAYSQAGFARAIADLDLNATNINLVGLTETGLQYAEYAA